MTKKSDKNLPDASEQADDATQAPLALVKCPTCGKRTIYAPSNPYRPFCSPLCKNEDLVGWAEERYRVPQTAADPDDEVEDEG